MRLALVVAVSSGFGCNALLDIGDLSAIGAIDAANAATDAPGVIIDAPPAPPDAPPAPIHALALATDYTNPGKIAELDVRAGTINTSFAAQAGIPAIGSDPLLRRLGTEVFVIGRLGAETIQILGGTPLALTDTFTLPAGSNIQDVAAAGTKLYVPAYGSTGVIVIDRVTRMTKTIPLLQTEDPDHHPNCGSAFYTGSRVYVACGLLNDATFVARGPGKIVVIDPFNDTVIRTIDLPYVNPIGLLEPTIPDAPMTGALTIGTAPSFTDFTSGCLVKLDLTTTPEPASCLVTNQALGGVASQAQTAPDRRHVWIASVLLANGGPDIYGRLVAYDLAGNQLATPASEPGWPIVDVAACADDYVVATERGTSEHGARIYHASTGGALLELGAPAVAGGGVVCY